jgi:hypothetical protein
MWPLHPAVRATLVFVMLVLAAVEILAELSPHGPTLVPLTAGHGVTVGDLPGLGLGAAAIVVGRPLVRSRRRGELGERREEGRS